jgi:hypothetical protein
VFTDGSQNLLSVFPPRPIRWKTFCTKNQFQDCEILPQNTHPETNCPRGAENQVEKDFWLVTDFHDHVFHLQLFYDVRLPGWELATESGNIGGNERFANGTTVRALFCSIFGAEQTTGRLPLLLDLLPPVYIYHFQLSRTSPAQLFLMDTFMTRRQDPTHWVIESIKSVSLSMLRHMPFEVSHYTRIRRTEALTDDQETRWLVRSPSTGECACIQSPGYFADQLLKRLPRKWIFRYLCFAAASGFGGCKMGPFCNYVEEYLRRFPKHCRKIRTCRYVVNNWLGRVWQSYQNVYVARCKTLHHISTNHVDAVVYLHHEVYRKQKQNIAFHQVQAWFHQHCHVEDALSYLELL